MDTVEQLIKSMNGFDPEFDLDPSGNVYKDVQEYVSKKLKDTRDGLRETFHSNKKLGVTQFVAWAVTRDSDLLAQSNWRAINKFVEEWTGVGETDPDNDADEYAGWHIERFGHWLCGWVEYLVIDLERIQYHVIQELIDLERGYENYPVLDEDLFTRMELDETVNLLVDEVDIIIRGFDPDLELDKDRVVAEFLADWRGDWGDNFDGWSEFEDYVTSLLNENYPDYIYPLAPSPESIAYDAAYTYPAPNQLSFLL